MNKFGASKTLCRQGHRHDSKKEAARCNALHTLLQAGNITDLTIQRHFLLIPAAKYPFDAKSERKCEYVADFAYMQNNKLIVEDTKGYKTKDYIIKRKLFKEKYCQNGDVIFKEV